MQLRSVQALRALAALAVLMGHLRSIESKHAGEVPVLSDFWVSGASGVDLFFVISGFIMVWVAGDMPHGRQSAGTFLFARVTRIYPLWWLFAGAMGLYLFASYGVPWDAETLAARGVGGAEHLIKSFALWPQNGLPVLNVGWTLVHEMYFYLVFTALILLVPVRFRLAAMLIWGGLVTLGAVFGLSGFFAKTLVELIFHPMSLEFLFGALAAFALQRGWRGLARAFLALGLTGFAVAWAFVAFDGSDPHLEWTRTFAFGVPSAFMLYGAVALDLQGRLSRAIPDLTVWIGDWSYALYLCHILVLSAVARLFFPVFSAPGIVDNVAFNILAALAAIGVAAATHLLFEKPVMALFRKLRRGLSKPAAS